MTEHSIHTCEMASQVVSDSLLPVWLPPQRCGGSVLSGLEPVAWTSGEQSVSQLNSYSPVDGTSELITTDVQDSIVPSALHLHTCQNMLLSFTVIETICQTTEISIVLIRCLSTGNHHHPNLKKTMKLYKKQQTY